MIENVIACDKARIPVVWFVTHEEARAELELATYIKKQKGSCFIWSLTSDKGEPGWEPARGFLKKKIPFSPAEEQAVPHAAILSLVNEAREKEGKVQDTGSGNSRVVGIFRDPHVFLDDEKSFVRALRDASRDLRDTDGLIVCISPVDELPVDLKTEVEIVHPGLPKKDTIKEMMDQLLKDFEIKYDNLDILANACTGLTLAQAADALAKSITQKKTVDIKFISEIKTKAISAVPGLTYKHTTPDISEAGGLAGLKEWIGKRKEGFSEEAAAYHLDPLRGVMLIGVSGCGKSLFAKAVAAHFKVPLIKLSPQDLKGGIVGTTEANIRQMQEAIDVLGHCVVWIDELEKSVQGAGEKSLDAGASDAILGGLLTWMEERKGGAFLIATANDVSRLAPELLRKGRWDTIFFVDLPSVDEREEILKIHLKKREQKLTQAEIVQVAEYAENCSGAEIESCVIDGMWKAFGDKKRALKVEDLIESLEEEVPLATTMKDSIDNLREWAETRARPASLTRKDRKIKKTGKRKINLEELKKK